MPLLASLKHRSFALLWSGQTLSRLGDSIYRVALAWWVLEKTGSATVLGKVFILSLAPMLLLALIGGVTVDRFSRVRVMLAADLMRFFVMASMAILAFGQLLEVWHVYAASIVMGSVEAFFQPAYTAALPDIIPRESLVSANSLTSLSRQLAQVVGPALSGVIVQLGSTSTAFALNAGTFLLSAACLVPALKSISPKTVSERGSMIRDLQDGLKTVANSSWLWITIGVTSLLNLTQGGPYCVSLPFLVKGSFHADAGSLGLTYSMFAVGSVVATLALNRFAVIRRRGILAYCALIVSGLMTLAFGLAPSLNAIFLFSFVLGASISVFGLIWVSTLQDIVQRDLLGRVVSIDYLGSYAFMPLSYGLTGWATDRFGVTMVFIVGGTLTAALPILGLMHSSIRRLN